jgi:hypothetical protein
MTAAAAILLSSLSLSACGGAAALFAGGGIGGTGFSTGAIIAFGSVIVNGVEFQTTDNTIRRLLDDSPNPVAGLDNEVFRAGMIVRVRHAAGDNTALQIDYKDDLEGPVANVDDAAGTFTVLGQPVAFDDATNFLLEPGATLADNVVAEVSGLYDGDGLLHATFIKLELSGKSEFEIKGFISNLDISLLTFDLGPIPGTATVAVSYAGAELRDLPFGLANGLYVEVKTPSTSGILVASSVEDENSVADDAPDDGEVEVEGFVTNLSGSDPNFTFLLNGVTVTTSLATAGRNNIAPNAHVEAEGTVSNGIFTADEIKSR